VTVCSAASNYFPSISRSKDIYMATYYGFYLSLVKSGADK